MNLKSMIVFSDNPKQLIEFYNKVFDTEPDWEGGDFVGYQVGDGHFMIGPHSKVEGKSKDPARIMFNFETDDVEGVFKRISAFAEVIAEPYNPKEDDKATMATLADPDGNYFQLMSPWED